MSYQEWQYQTSRGISATLALGPGRALILADLSDSFMTIIPPPITNAFHCSMTYALLKLTVSTRFLTKVLYKQLFDLWCCAILVDTKSEEVHHAADIYCN